MNYGPDRYIWIQIEVKIFSIFMEPGGLVCVEYKRLSMDIFAIL